jgi:phosphoesterase RecJ-like protein
VSDLDDVVEALRLAPSVAVLAHIHPEGDAIGATLAATLSLREAGKIAAPYNADPLPPGLSSLPGAGEINREVPIRRPFACYLVLDTADLDRTGGLLEGRPSDAVVLNVDHHAGNRRFGNVNWVDPHASSAGEMVYRILRQGGLPIGKEVATNLYAAILTDTGGFRYGNTTPEALRAAARLVECGVAVEEVTAGLYWNRDSREWRLLGEVLTNLRVSEDGRISWIEVTLELLARVGLRHEAADDFIDYARAVRGVEIAVAFKEISPAEVRVSFRSRGANDVARVAKQFGGGGHRNAAGCTLHTSLAEARSRVLSAAAASLNANV